MGRLSSYQARHLEDINECMTCKAESLTTSSVTSLLKYNWWFYPKLTKTYELEFRYQKVYNMEVSNKPVIDGVGESDKLNCVSKSFNSA